MVKTWSSLRFQIRIRSAFPIEHQASSLWKTKRILPLNRDRWFIIFTTKTTFIRTSTTRLIQPLIRIGSTPGNHRINLKTNKCRSVRQSRLRKLLREWKRRKRLKSRSRKRRREIKFLWAINEMSLRGSIKYRPRIFFMHLLGRKIWLKNLQKLLLRLNLRQKISISLENCQEPKRHLL